VFRSAVTIEWFIEVLPSLGRFLRLPVIEIVTNLAGVALRLGVPDRCFH
jgi:hypothetical protein